MFLRNLALELAWHLIPPGFYFLFMYWCYPYREIFILSTDEGYELIKALLVLKGYPLYTQVWSDQPPFFTYLLTGLYRVYGLDLYTSRLLVLAISCVLLWAVVQYLRLVWGKWHAFFGAILLILVPNYPLLSMSVIIGLPAVSLAFVSLLALTLWHRKRQWIWLLLSALALSFSVLTKLFTGFLGPVFILGLVVDEYVRSGENRKILTLLRPALFWLAAFVVSGLGLGLLFVPPVEVAQLVQTHWAVSQVQTFSIPLTREPNLNAYVLEAWPILLLTLLGVILVFRERRWLLLYPLAWMLVAYLLLLSYRPVWWHQVVLVTVPAAVLAGVGAGETLLRGAKLVRARAFRSRDWLLVAAGLVSLALVFSFRPGELATQVERRFVLLGRPNRKPPEEQFLKKILEYAPDTHWMVTDLPVYAFRAGLPTPPNLAVISWKRLVTGDLTEEMILDEVEQYRPEQVLLARFDYPFLEEYLLENYQVVKMDDERMKLYVRNDLLQ